MFEISKLKEKKLSELQEIAEELKISKYKTLKKLDLVYKILDHQASNPDEKDVDKTEKRDSSKFKTRNRTNKKNPSDKKLNEELWTYFLDLHKLYLSTHLILLIESPISLL